jgi:hypothetical protein
MKAIVLTLGENNVNNIVTPAIFGVFENNRFIVSANNKIVVDIFEKIYQTNIQNIFDLILNDPKYKYKILSADIWNAPFDIDEPVENILTDYYFRPHLVNIDGKDVVYFQRDYYFIKKINDLNNTILSLKSLELNELQDNALTMWKLLKKSFEIKLEKYNKNLIDLLEYFSNNSISLKYFSNNSVSLEKELLKICNYAKNNC